MKDVAKQYNFTKKDMVLTKYSNWFKGVKDGSPNGSNDLKNMGSKVSKTKAVLQGESGEKPLSIWLRRSFLSGQNWKVIRAAVLPSQELEQRLSTGSLNKETSVKFLLFPLLPTFSPVMEKRVELRSKGITIINPILPLRQKGWETFIKQTLWDHDTSGVPKESPGFILFIPWMWQAIRLSPVSSLINRRSLCADIWLRHGDPLGFQRYLKWIMRWLPQVEDATPIAFLKLSDSICFWVSIWYLSHRENQVEMHLLRVLMDSGKKEYLEGIIVLPSLPLEEPVKVFCGITIIRNHIEGLPKRNMVQDSLGYSETISGNPSDICQRVLLLRGISILMDILTFLLPKEKSHLSEKSTLMVKLRSTAFLTSFGENLRVNMLWLLFLLIERDWLLNKRIKSSNLFLSQLRVILFLLFFQLQRRRLRKVYDVIRLLSIKNQFTMLLVQSPSKSLQRMAYSHR
jgi:hypothetical protein